MVDGQLAVRKVCQVALSFDHRVMDGQQGSQFLADVGALLADPGMAMVFSSPSRHGPNTYRIDSVPKVPTISARVGRIALDS